MSSAGSAARAGGPGSGVSRLVILVVHSLGLGACLAPARGDAQDRPPARMRMEARADLIRSTRGGDGRVHATNAVHGSIGGAVPLGRYVRLAVIGGAGVTDDRDELNASARGDVVARFVLDPDFGDRWAPYAGGGLTARYERPAAWRGYLNASLGLEGPRVGRLAPFLELGFSGGRRLGIGLRDAAGGRR